MNNEHYLIGVLIEDTTYSYMEISHKLNIPKDILTEMIEQGLLPRQSAEMKDGTSLSQEELRRIQSAFHLYQDLGINPPGVTLAIELLEEMDKMRQELEILRKHF